MAKAQGEALISVAEASKMMGVSRVQVGTYIRTKKLPATRIGRTYVIRRADVLSFEKPAQGRPSKKRTK